MEAPTQSFVNLISEIAKKEIELRALILKADTLYNGDPNWDALITQQDIDTVSAYVAAGITPQRIADVIYAAKIADTAVAGNLPSMFVLASL